MPRMFVSELILFVSENGADVDESNAKKWRALSYRKKQAPQKSMAAMRIWNIGCVRNQCERYR